MKIIMESEYCTNTLESEGDKDIHDLMDMVRQSLLAMSYHPESVRRGFEGIVDEYEQSDEN